jgi:hypothetical protein
MLIEPAGETEFTSDGGDKPIEIVKEVHSWNNLAK